jgi:hypothetical protein
MRASTCVNTIGLQVVSGQMALEKQDHPDKYIETRWGSHSLHRYTCTHMYTYTGADACGRSDETMYPHTQAHKHALICKCTRLCTHTHTYIHRPISEYIHTYLHTHLHTHGYTKPVCTYTRRQTSRQSDGHGQARAVGLIAQHFDMCAFRMCGSTIRSLQVGKGDGSGIDRP